MTATDDQMDQIRRLVRALKTRKRYSLEDIAFELYKAGYSERIGKQTVHLWTRPEAPAHCQKPELVLSVLDRLYHEDR